MKKVLLLGFLVLTLGLAACEPEVEEDVSVPTSGYASVSILGIA